MIFRMFLTRIAFGGHDPPAQAPYSSWCNQPLNVGGVYSLVGVPDRGHQLGHGTWGRVFCVWSSQWLNFWPEEVAGVEVGWASWPLDALHLLLPQKVLDGRRGLDGCLVLGEQKSKREKNEIFSSKSRQTYSKGPIHYARRQTLNTDFSGRDWLV